jgi:hypothetical protein
MIVKKWSKHELKLFVLRSVDETVGKLFCLLGGEGVARRSESMTSLLSTHFFHVCTMHLDVFKVFYSQTDATVNCFKNNIKIYI